MKMARGVILAIAFLAILLSLAPLVAHGVTPQNPDPSGGDSGGSATWTVVCQYDEYDHYLGKTCTSGGHESCACP